MKSVVDQSEKNPSKTKEAAPPLSDHRERANRVQIVSILFHILKKNILKATLL